MQKIVKRFSILQVDDDYSLKVLGSACAENRATTRKKHGVNLPTGSIFGGPMT
jgi:hypothetical protein